MSSSENAPSVWRLRMKSGADGIDHAAARQFAIDNGFVGAGWGLTDPPDPDPLPDGCTDASLYLDHAKEVYPDHNTLEGVVQIFNADMRKGDYCWLYVTHTAGCAVSIRRRLPGMSE